jgi:two-component system, OmpR family, alkaline phosphatase synthesis response regulator PhoP
MLSRLRPRFRGGRWGLVIGLAVLPSALLAYWAWQASVRRHAVTVALLESHAQLADQRFVSRLSDEFYIGSTAMLRPVRGGRFSDERAAASLDPQLVLDSVDAVMRCRCAPVLIPAFAFRTNFTDAGTKIVGPTTLTGDERAALLSAARRHVDSLRGGWDVAIVPSLVVESRHLLFITHRSSPSRVETIFGIGVDTAALAYRVLRPLLRDGSLAPELALAGVANDSLFALRLADGSDATIFRTRTAPDSEYAVSMTMRPEWGRLSVIASAREPVARALLSSGMPRSPTPMLLALLGVGGALIAGSLAVLWRILELARMRSDFTSSVSHELRTPLTQILLYAEGLELGHHASRAERVRALGIITREARRLIQLVENVLHVSRAERRLVSVDAAPVSLTSLAAQVIEAFAPVAAARSAIVVLEGDDGVTARLDTDAFRRILLNLLDNAVRHGPPGQTITVRIDASSSWARLRVDDEGPGIAERDRARVWQPFVRLDHGSAEHESGTGIGLTIVRELVTRAEAACVSKCRSWRPLRRRAPTRTSASAEERGSIAGGRHVNDILLIEDHRDIAEGLRNSLDIEGYTVEVAHDGEAGLARLRREPPKLVVLDVMLPGLDGFHVLRRLRDEGFEMPVLILSARGDEVDKVRGFRIGADDYLTKPFGLRELLARVDALFRRRRRLSTDVPAPVSVVRFGDLEIHIASRTVSKRGSTVGLRPKEFDLLRALAMRPETVVSRRELLDEVWGYDREAETRTVDTRILSLRRKIEDDPANPTLLVTARKAGYILKSG